jgi:nucleoside-diphosphate-sugar epimerase
MAWRFLITGATGFIGGHVAEACVERGHGVSAISRNRSDTALLERLGVTLHRGELTDANVVRQAVEGADVVVHCAAKVGDRGPVEDYRAVNVEALRGLLEACRGRPLHRFIHMSSLGVYEARHHHGTDETEPLPATHLDGYTQTKVEAEHLARQYYQQHHVPVVILRPGFVYGARDRAVLPKLVERLKIGRMHFLGGDLRALNTIYVGNLVDAVFLAVDNPNAPGQAYNLTDGEVVTRQRFINAISDGMGLAHPRQILPRWLAGVLVRILQRQIRRAGTDGKPFLSHAQLKFLVLNLDFSIEKAKRELGYRPRVPFDEAMRQTMASYRENA